MESSELRDLLEFLAKSQFAEFEIEREGFRLRVVKASAATHSIPGNGGAPAATVLSQQVIAHAPAPGESPTPAVDDKLLAVTSPIVGTFYRTPAPDSPPFVELGGIVKKGQVLCIVEAMKLMNEIESEVEGEVVEVLVSNGQPVEYGEILFRIRPAA